MTWEAEKTQYGDCYYVWVHGGRVAEDGSHIASIKWPAGSVLKIPEKHVLMSVASFAELSFAADKWRGAQSRPMRVTKE